MLLEQQQHHNAKALRIGIGINRPWLNALPTNANNAINADKLKNSLALRNPLSSSVTSKRKIPNAWHRYSNLHNGSYTHL